MMELLKKALQDFGHYAAIHEGEIFTNSPFTIRKDARGFVLTDDRNGAESTFTSEKAVVDFLNVNGNTDMMEFLKTGRTEKGFFLLQAHNIEIVSEKRRKALKSAYKRIKALEDLATSKRSTAKLTHCEICGVKLSKKERGELGTECQDCADKLREAVNNIAKKQEGGKNDEQ